MKKIRDYDIRNCLKNEVLKEYYEDGYSKVIQEYGILWGSSRIDIAVINGNIHAYEIKSEADTLYRLQSQIINYKKICDYINLAVSIDKYHKIDNNREFKKNLKDIGIIVFWKEGESIKWKIKKAPKKNNTVDKYSLVQLLWRDEALELLTKHNLSNKIKSKPRKVLYENLCQNFSLHNLSKEVREIIKNRDYSNRITV